MLWTRPSTRSLTDPLPRKFAEALRKPARGEQQAKSTVNTPTCRPIEPSRYDERWEIHVHDAPAGTPAAHPRAVTPNRLAGVTLGKSVAVAEPADGTKDSAGGRNARMTQTG
jgi:hypothetical protein